MDVRIAKRGRAENFSTVPDSNSSEHCNHNFVTGPQTFFLMKSCVFEPWQFPKSVLSNSKTHNADTQQLNIHV